MADIVDFTLGGKIPNLYDTLRFEREHSTSDLIRTDYKLKKLIGEKVPEKFDLYISTLEAMCQGDEWLDELKEKIKANAKKYWFDLVGNAMYIDGCNMG